MRREEGGTCINAVAIMTPLPKNFAMINAIFGIFKAGILFANIGKKAPIQSQHPSISPRRTNDM